MSEPLPPAPQTPEAPQAPKKITIGETELYLSTPMTVGDKTIDSIVIQPTGKRGAAGAESSVLLVSEPSRKKGEEGVLVDKPVLHVDPMDEMDWDKISGVQWTDDGGVSHTIPKEELSLEKPADRKSTRLNSSH